MEGMGYRVAYQKTGIMEPVFIFARRASLGEAVHSVRLVMRENKELKGVTYWIEAGEGVTYQRWTEEEIKGITCLSSGRVIEMQGQLVGLTGEGLRPMKAMVEAPLIGVDPREAGWSHAERIELAVVMAFRWMAWGTEQCQRTDEADGTDGTASQKEQVTL